MFRLRTLPALAVSLAAFSGAALAETPPDECTRPAIEKVEGPNIWQPGPGGEQVSLWPEGAPITPPETDGNTEWTGNGSPLVAGRTWNWATYVTRPTMTVYPPKGENTGAAMLVLPGGGYAAVAMDLEGTEVCDWITAHGVTCVILKYRTPQVWRRDETGAARQPDPLLPLEDAQRAVSLLRRDAAARGIDPARIGVIGFSAGGHLAAMLSNAGARTYDLFDDADEISPYPDYAILLYPGRLWKPASARTDMTLAGWVTINPAAPPTLLIHAMNDPVDDIRQSVAYGLALSDAGVPVDMRFFAKGCHAFGLRPTDDPITTEWPGMAVKWLENIGVL